jgi:NAD(P)-dependent dehydrogenase (short-subunit alcohol dehydrogenase family)
MIGAMSENQSVVLVTGGAYGIGRGICRYFASRGWRVVIADLNQQRGLALQQELAGSCFYHRGSP